MQRRRRSKILSLMAVIYLAALSLLINTASAVPPLENYNDGIYQISDPEDDLTVYDNRIEVDTMRRIAADVYVCKDFGEGYFKNWTIAFDWQVNSSGDNTELRPVGVSNVGYDRYYDCRNDIFSVCGYYSSTWNTLRLALHTSHPYESVYWNGLNYNTHYWCLFKRYGTTLWIELYTDSARTQLAQNVSKSCWPDDMWQGRYLYAQQGQGYVGTNTITGFIQNHQILDPLPQVLVDVNSTPQSNFVLNGTGYTTPQTDISLDQGETYSFTAPDSFIQGNRIYYFDYWLINGSTTSTANPLITTMNGNTILRMYWESNVERAVGIATPYAYSAIVIWSLSLIVAVGAGLIVSWQTQEFTLGMVTTVIVCVGIMVALFIALPLLNAFSAL